MALALRPLRPAPEPSGRSAAGAAGLAAVEPDSMLLSLAVCWTRARLLRALDAPEAIRRSFVRGGAAKPASSARALSNPARRGGPQAARGRWSDADAHSTFESVRRDTGFPSAGPQ